MLQLYFCLTSEEADVIENWFPRCKLSSYGYQWKLLELSWRGVGPKCLSWELPKIKIPKMAWMFWAGQGPIYSWSRWSHNRDDSATYLGSSQTTLFSVKSPRLISNETNCSSRDSDRPFDMIHCYPMKEGKRWLGARTIIELCKIFWSNVLMIPEVKGSVLNGICSSSGWLIALHWAELVWLVTIIAVRKKMT